MKALRTIGLCAGAVVLGALLAPWLFWACQWAGTRFPSFPGLAEQPFRQSFNRAMLLVALAGLWPLLGALEIRSLKQVGFVRDPRAGWHLLLGFGWGIISIVVALVLARAPLHFNRTGAAIAGKSLNVFANAVLVAVIEETIFRGGLQGALQRRLKFLPALALTSAIYSALHFVKPLGFDVAADRVDWRTGFSCLGYILSRWVGKPDMAVALVGLFLAGWILGWAYAKTGALYLSIGLHAGWVLAIQLARWLDGGNIIENVLAWPVLVALWAVVAWICRRSGPISQPGASAPQRPPPA